MDGDQPKQTEPCLNCGQWPWQETCRHCGGDGFEPNSDDEPCNNCAGVGYGVVCDCNRHYNDWEV